MQCAQHGPAHDSMWSRITAKKDKPLPLTKFLDGAKLCVGGSSHHSGRQGCQSEGLARQEKEADENLAEYKKSECRVLHLAQHKPVQEDRLEDGWLGSSSAEKDPVILLDKLNMSHHCALAAGAANCILGCIGNREQPAGPRSDPSPLFVALVRPWLQHCIQFGGCCYKKDIDILRSVQWRPTKMVRGLERCMGRA